MNALMLLASFLVAAAPDPQMRSDISLDIYNRDQALIREVRSVQLDKGENTVDFTGIADGIYGHTMRITPLEDAAELTTISTSFNYDLVSAEKLIKKYLGQWFEFETEDGPYYGKLLSYDATHFFLQPDTSISLIWMVERGEMKDVYLPGIPNGLFAVPTIRWEVESEKKLKNLPVEISYITDAVSWLCDYRAEVIGEDKLLLSGVFTLRNNLPLEFPGAEIDLVAGSTHRTEDGNWDEAASDPGAGGQAVSGTKLFEYYRYALERKVDLNGDQTIQVPFFDNKEVTYQKRYVFPHLLDANQVLVNLKFDNVLSDGLGMPMPEGDMGIYRRDANGRLHFIGEDAVPATPTGSQIELNIGRAFDLTAKRTRLIQARPSRDKHSETWQIDLSNGGDSLAVVEVEQRVFGYYTVSDVKIDGKASKYRNEAADKLVFPVPVKANSSAKLKFTLEYGY